MQKIRRTAAMLDSVFKIMYYLTLAALIFGILMMAIVWLLYLGNPNILDSYRPALNFGMIQFRVAESVVPAREHGFLSLVLCSLLMIAQLPVFCLFFRTIRGILAPIRKGLPFHDEIPRHLNRLGWLTIADGLLSNFSDLIACGNLLPGYDLGELFLSDKIISVTAGYSFSLTFLIYAFILFLLSYIFRYGLELQQLSDETL